jgi:hypothetical protein
VNYIDLPKKTLAPLAVLNARVSRYQPGEFVKNKGKELIQKKEQRQQARGALGRC